MTTYTIEHFLTILTCRITNEDRKAQARALKTGRAFNHYALSHMLGADKRVHDSVRKVWASSTSEAFKLLQSAIEKEFTRMRWRDRLLRDIDRYVATGKKPKLH